MVVTSGRWEALDGDALAGPMVLRGGEANDGQRPASVALAMGLSVSRSRPRGEQQRAISVPPVPARPSLSSVLCNTAALPSAVHKPVSGATMIGNALPFHWQPEWKTSTGLVMYARCIPSCVKAAQCTESFDMHIACILFASHRRTCCLHDQVYSSLTAYAHVCNAAARGNLVTPLPVRAWTLLTIDTHRLHLGNTRSTLIQPRVACRPLPAMAIVPN